MGQELEIIKEFLKNFEESAKFSSNMKDNEMKIVKLETEVTNMKNQITKIETTMEQSKYLTISTLVTALVTLGSLFLMR